MKHCKLLSFDLAKTVFQLCDMDLNHHVFFNKKVNRNKLLESVTQIKPDTIVMESCYSANYWGRHNSVVATAHKMARIIKTVLAKNQKYNPNHVSTGK
ncbi:MAG: hypothetical protein R3E90_02110 [Marinicella sp.]|nr:hypothetical protein [Xanthomonadales bacterium]